MKSIHHTTTTQVGSRRCGHKVQERINLFQLLPLPPLLCAQFIGAMYVHSASGVSIPSPRRVYLEASNPEKPVMRVPESQDDERKVVTSYSWDRSEHAHTSTEPLGRADSDSHRRHSDVRCTCCFPCHCQAARHKTECLFIWVDLTLTPLSCATQLASFPCSKLCVQELVPFWPFKTTQLSDVHACQPWHVWNSGRQRNAHLHGESVKALLLALSHTYVYPGHSNCLDMDGAWSTHCSHFSLVMHSCTQWHTHTHINLLPPFALDHFRNYLKAEGYWRASPPTSKSKQGRNGGISQIPRRHLGCMSTKWMAGRWRSPATSPCGTSSASKALLIPLTLDFIGRSTQPSRM